MNFIQLFVGLAMLMAGLSAQAGVVIVVNANETAAPTKSEISNIFLGRSKSLKGLDQSGWNPTKEVFYLEMTKKNEAQLSSYWSGLVFTGKGAVLDAVDGDAKVVEKIAAAPGSIGYVDSAAVTPGVKVVLALP